MSLSEYIGKYWTGAEAIYGVIIVMTFTSVLRSNGVVFEQMHATIILAALACCIAWGITDGLFYVWERSSILRQENHVIRLSRSESQGESAVSLVGDELDDTILRYIPREKRLDLYRKLVQYLSGAQEGNRMSLRDTATIVLGTSLLSLGAGLVVVVPFFLGSFPVLHLGDAEIALKVSNLLGILLLFGVGVYRAVRRDLASKIISGFGTALIGIIIAGITIALGG